MDLRTLIGQHLCAGFPGLELTEDFRRKLREARVGNIVLFAHNIGTREQVLNLCREIQELVTGATGYPAFIFIDQEGGVVSRLGSDCTIMPSAMGVAATGDPGLAYTAGLVTGSELRALGINFDLAPVMDVNSNPDNPVIGVRSYGDSPEAVIPCALAMARGLSDGGVYSCAKHFPGHGDTAVDSHLGLPRVDKSLAELEACELRPFLEAIRAGIPAVMSSHILFPALEPEALPATMSRKVMTGLLKEKMGFHGLVVSDCMMMRAIADHYGSLEGILAAISAGVDLVYASHSIDLAAQAAERLRAEWQAGTLDREELEASTHLILRLKASLPADQPGAMEQVGSPGHLRLADEIYEKSLTIVHLPQGGIPEPGENPLFIGCKAYVPTLASSPQEAGYSFPEALQARFHGTALFMSENPGPEEVAALAKQAPGHSSVVIGTYNGHLRTGQLDVVRAMAQAHPRVLCLALRNPYDLAGLPDSVTAIAAFSYNRPALKAICRLLAGEIQATGRMPVRMKG